MRLFPEDQHDNVLIFGAVLILFSIFCFAYNYVALTLGEAPVIFFLGRLERDILNIFPMGLILFPCILFILTLFCLVYEITISGIALFVLKIANIILAIKAYPIILASIQLWR
jgi:hypothetical protein